ncbi:Taurine catabolism dioxygenase TauD/TfdA [Penicillium odoratum]|uniref:Taurine catabolism dioxygenase TauD/TfdA n=1 Tax=Penicillium odoratum TaxID=1167516 RepID=UPI0025493DEA|nr:Taurine catabolism dioxygenase TauD/TfdA [Penicillium odoratum]KAJ5771927.1 Taurine catabolism dioxygenase TauD/TfdA [Penicillium odoratum]
MHRFFRSLHPYSTRAASNYNGNIHKRMNQSRTISCSIPRIDVPSLSLASEASHLKAVHETLEANGVLQLQLGFADPESNYLENLVHHLHINHQHGLPINHSAERGWFWDVRPCINAEHLKYQARSETMHKFDWHTDCSYEERPPKYFALQVLQPDRCGGGVLSVLDVDRLLRMLSPFAQKWLAGNNYRINVPPEFIKEAGEDHIVGNLLLAKPEGQSGSQLRLRVDITVPLTNDAAKALEELKQTLWGDAVGEEILHLSPNDLPQGSIIVMNNRRWLHSRNEVKDPGRHLRRIRWDARPFGAT